jgi:hypothetical protein
MQAHHLELKLDSFVNDIDLSNRVKRIPTIQVLELQPIPIRSDPNGTLIPLLTQVYSLMKTH